MSYFKPGEEKEKHTLRVDRNMKILKVNKEQFDIECDGKIYSLFDVDSKSYTIHEWIE